jgi:Putative metal-binding motif
MGHGMVGPRDPDAPNAARPRTIRRKAVAIGAALALGFVSTIVLAEWLASGSGEGYARAGVAQPLTTVSATPAASLYPGQTGDLLLRVHNPNPFVVTLTSVAPNGAITSDIPACDAAGHGVSFAGHVGSHPLAASGITELVLTDVITMAATSANECQGATFTIPVTLNGGSTPPLESLWYVDADQDGFGDPVTSLLAATPPAGYVADSTDCDDTNPAVFPGATEVSDGIDNDCDGVIDDDVVDGLTWFLDADLDAFGNPSSFVLAASAPPGYVANADDCDDTNALVNPGAQEVADPSNVDEDCDGLADDADPDVAGTTPWFQDADADGFGDPTVVLVRADQPPGHVAFAGDCDDANNLRFPGAIELLDGIDNDCDEVIDEGLL